MKTSNDLSTRVNHFLSDKASQFPGIERVILFGSRARGDAKARSDFDIAIVAPSMDRLHQSRFISEIEENIPTLCSIDLVFLTPSTASELTARIRDEGIVIYERAA